MYVVTGATGNTGAVVAERLLTAGKRVRVLVRNADKAAQLAKRGAEIVVGTLEDSATLKRAFHEAEGVYFLSPPDITSHDFITERERLTQSVVDALASAQAKHVVLLSSIGAQHASGTGPIVSVHNIEQQLTAANLPTTFLRAAYFIENWASVLPVAKQDGVLPTFIPATFKFPMVATHDIGLVAAKALLEGPRQQRIIELAGPTEANAEDIAAAASKIFGRPIKAIDAPLDAIIPTLTKAGATQEFATLFRELNQGIASSHITWENTGELIRGPTSIEEVLRNLT